MGSALSQEASHLPLKKVLLISSACGSACGLLFLGGSIFFLRRETSKILSRISSLEKEGLDREDRLQKLSATLKEEVLACAEDLTPFKELRSGIERLISDYKSQLVKKEKERERNEERVKEVEVKIEDSERENATDRTERYLREQQSLLDDQGELEKRKNELEEKKLQIEKLLQKADKMDKATRERLETLKTLVDSIISLLGGGSGDERTRLCREEV